MEIKIRVTQDHITNGVMRDCKHCPVAQALLESIPECYSVVVDNFSGLPEGQDEEGWEAIISINTAIWGKHKTLPNISLPKEVGKFANSFDKGEEVQSLVFNLILPDIIS